MSYHLAPLPRSGAVQGRKPGLLASRAILQAAAVVGVSLVASLAGPARALGFSGAYDPTNWTTSFGGGGDGSVDTTGAPNLISITGPDNGLANSYIDYTTTAAASGTVSFSWLYQTSDSPAQDSFGYLLGSTYTMLSDNAISNPTGTSSFAVNSGDIFGYRVFSIDGSFGPGIASIYTFSAPDPAVVPAPLPLFGAVGAFVLSRRLRRRIQGQRRIKTWSEQPKALRLTGPKKGD